MRHGAAERGEPALSDLGLAVPRSEVVALLGPSRAGKTTLLALLDGRLRGWRGRAVVLGRALSPQAPTPRETRADVGFVFQVFALVERPSVLRNALNGRLGRTTPWRALLGRRTDADTVAAERAVAECAFADLAERWPAPARRDRPLPRAGAEVDPRR